MNVEEYIKSLPKKRRNSILEKAIEYDEPYLVKEAINAGADIKDNITFLKVWASTKGYQDILDLLDEVR